MPTKKSKFGNVVSTIDRWISIIGMIYIVIALAILLLIGFESIFVEQVKSGVEGILGYWWQFIGFSFVLASLIANIPTMYFKKNRTILLHYIVFAFIFAGVFFIPSFGFFYLYGIHKSLAMFYFANIFFHGALFAISLGISAMFTGMFERLLELSEEKMR